MRKYIRNNLLDVFKTLYEAHDSVVHFIDKEDFDNAVYLLGECQNTAVQIGDIIDNSEGEGSSVIHLLEEYCETVYRVSVDLNEGVTGTKAGEMLDRSLLKAENGVKNDIPVKSEIVFMPYNASMWDSLESVWKAADDDPDCDAYVVPIPYYEKNPDGTLAKYHYEGEKFPEYVPITHYNTYDLASRRPDAIYIHNPYDNNNFITTVDPRYYSSELKKYTDMLVYIPYFVLEDREKWDDKYLEYVEKYVLVPAVMNADKVIVQSENMLKLYIRTLLKYCGDSPEQIQLYTEKVQGTGSPKFDKVAEAIGSNDIPDEWFKLIDKPDGTRKKIVFYNTTITPVMNYGEKIILKIRSVLDVFYKHRDDIALLWRPHPLMKETIKSMNPELYDEYVKIVDEYVNAKWGIYDDTPDLDRAVAMCDAYYGDKSSVVQLFERTGKTISIQMPDTPGIIPYSECVMFPSFINAGGTPYFVQYFTNSLYCMVNDKIRFVGMLPSRLPFDTRQHISSVYYNGHLYFLPCNSNTIVDYDINSGGFTENTLDICHSVFPLWGYENNFRNGLIYNNRLYLIPSYYDAIVYYDFETKKTVHCLNLKEVLSTINYKDDIIFQNYEFYTDKIILLPFIHSNHILQFDLETFEYKIHKAGTGTGFISIYKYDDIYWLLERQRPIIFKWDPETEDAEITEPYPDEFVKSVKKSIFGTLSTERIGKYLFCFAGYGNMSVKIDLETGKCQRIAELDKYVDNNKTNGLVFHSAICVGDDVYLHYTNGQSIVKYRIFTGETSEIAFSFEDAIQKKDIDKLNNIVLNALKSDCKQRIAPENTCGNLIYENIKKQ